ncbi:hypothetical protein SCLCIDRAFT_181338 [Scleroderma citrinum Foug A]|uniref:Uncharacterized protein n=1 Tax=Scleroderma citrinum Foug A TaxID=1036808 RepID=A0A0C3EG76_9AGAM|nr:hypothetical protein SCLCIDRAFT_181338 [Scleroderma citrinum Foug A]
MRPKRMSPGRGEALSQMRSHFTHSLPQALHLAGDERHHHRSRNPRHKQRRTGHTSRVIRRRGPAPNDGFRQENSSRLQAHREASCSVAGLSITSFRSIYTLAFITTHLQSPLLHELITKALFIVYSPCIPSNSSPLLFILSCCGRVQAFMYKYPVYTDPFSRRRIQTLEPYFWGETGKDLGYLGLTRQ